MKLKISTVTTANRWDFEEDNKFANEYNWWYLHGELEKYVGYDKGFLIEGPSDYLEGRFNIIIDEVPEQCVGYFWLDNKYDTMPKQRGFVCLASDKAAIEYAKRMYKTRPRFL